MGLSECGLLEVRRHLRRRMDVSQRYGKIEFIHFAVRFGLFNNHLPRLFEGVGYAKGAPVVDYAYVIHVPVYLRADRGGASLDTGQGYALFRTPV